MRTIIKLALFFIAGIFLGILVGKTDIFKIFFLIAITGVVTLIYLVGSIAAYILKSKRSILKNYVGLMALALVVSTVTSLMTMHNMIERKQKIANELIPKLARYHQQNLKYPETLIDLGTANNDIITYWSDSTRQTYTIHLLRDGWHFSRYDSESKQWTSGD